MGLNEPIGGPWGAMVYGSPILAAAICALVYISDYVLTLQGARLYREVGRKYMRFAHYELNPAFREDIEKERKVSPKFIVSLVWTAGLVWLVVSVSPWIELKELVLGAFYLSELAIHMRHLRNIAVFRSMRIEDAYSGHLQSASFASYASSSLEMFGWAGFFLLLYLWTGDTFFAGGIVSMVALAAKHQATSAKLRREGRK
jgi:hypothetical protein